MKKSTEKVITFCTGIFCLFGLLLFSVIFPHPTPLQYFICRLILSLAAGFAVAFVSGFLEVDFPFGVRAGGGLAAFAIVYFYAPAALGAVTE